MTNCRLLRSAERCVRRLTTLHSRGSALFVCMSPGFLEKPAKVSFSYTIIKLTLIDWLTKTTLNLAYQAKIQSTLYNLGSYFVLATFHRTPAISSSVQLMSFSSFDKQRTLVIGIPELKVDVISRVVSKLISIFIIIIIFQRRCFVLLILNFLLILYFLLLL